MSGIVKRGFGAHDIYILTIVDCFFFRNRTGCTAQEFITLFGTLINQGEDEELHRMRPSRPPSDVNLISSESTMLESVTGHA